MFTRIDNSGTTVYDEQETRNRADLRQLMELIEMNLQQYQRYANPKKLAKTLQQLQEVLGRSILREGNHTEMPYLKQLEELEWIASDNIRVIINRLRVWNDEVEERMLKLRSEEIGRYRNFIQQRPSEYNASTHTGSVLLGDFPIIRRATLGEYLMLYGQHL